MSSKKKTAKKTFELKPYESKYFLVQKTKNVKEQPLLKDVVLSGEFNRVSVSDNYLVLDKAEFSTDGKKYNNEQFIPAIFEYLLKQKYEGDIYLKFKFKCMYQPKEIKVMYENCQHAEIFVNGNAVKFCDKSSMDENMILGSINNYVVVGDNEIIEKVHFYQKENVYYALFGENVTESIKNCLVYDTYLDVLRLVGDFGVYEENGLKKSDLPNYYIGNNNNEINNIFKFKKVKAK